MGHLVLAICCLHIVWVVLVSSGDYGGNAAHFSNFMETFLEMWDDLCGFRFWYILKILYSVTNCIGNILDASQRQHKIGIDCNAVITNNTHMLMQWPDCKNKAKYPHTKKVTTLQIWFPLWRAVFSWWIFLYQDSWQTSSKSIADD